jgi:hypothetical protein
LSVMFGLPDGRHRMFCCPVDIHSKRNTPIMRPKFLGTDDDWGKVTDANADEWYGEEPDPTAQARFNEIVAAHDEYRAAVTAVMDRSGLKAALKIADQLEDERLDLREQIEAIQCTTIEGIRMRARIVFETCWNSEPDDDIDAGEALDGRLMNRLVFELVGQPFPKPKVDEDQSERAEA